MSFSDQDDTATSSVAADEQVEDSSPQEESEVEESMDDSEIDDLPDSEEEQPESNVPFHKHPRFQQLIEKNRQLEAEMDRLRSQREEQKKVASMSSEEKAVHDLKQKYGFVTKEDIDSVKKQNALLKDQIDFEKFVKSTPEAANYVEAIRSIAYSPGNTNKSYKEIYSEFFGQKQEKVVKRRVKTGMKTISGGKKSNSGRFTREQIAKMSPEEYVKNRSAINKQMAEGKIL